MRTKVSIIPGFDAIRFIAASLVLITHIERFKRKAQLENFSFVVDDLGYQGVSIFFVLSGFLITHLLLVEKHNRKSIDVKKFYVKRILRIWPLYFIILILGFFVFPYSYYPHYFPNPKDYDIINIIILSTLFLPNLATYLSNSFFATGILWSIGVEEQFYLIWPHIVKLKVTIRKIMTIIVMVIIFKLLLLTFSFGSSLIGYWSNIAFKFLRHDGIIVGTLFALLNFRLKNRLLHIAGSQLIVITSFAIPIISQVCKLVAMLDPYSEFILNTINYFCYAVIIVNIGFNGLLKKLTTVKIVNYLGKISYGIYMFHSIAIAISLELLLYLKYTSGWKLHVAHFILSIAITLFFSSCSFKFLESPILRYKNKLQ